MTTQEQSSTDEDKAKLAELKRKMELHAAQNKESFKGKITTLEAVCKTYCAFFCNDGSPIVEVSHRNFPEVGPDNAFGYKFYDIWEVELLGQILSSEPQNESGTTYIGGDFYTMDEFKKAFPDHGRLRENYAEFRILGFVKAGLGRLKPVFEHDKVLERKKDGSWKEIVLPTLEFAEDKLTTNVEPEAAN